MYGSTDPWLFPGCVASALAVGAAIGYWVGRCAGRRTEAGARTGACVGRLKGRRVLDELLAAQLAAMGRYESRFSLALLAVDHSGADLRRPEHQSMEQIPKDFVRLVEDQARETDILARYGPSELVLVMPHTDLLGACQLADRLRALAQQSMPWTVHGGVTAALDGDTKESLLARAEIALDCAQTAGGNRVFCHDGNQPEPVSAETWGAPV